MSEVAKQIQDHMHRAVQNMSTALELFKASEPPPGLPSVAPGKFELTERDLERLDGVHPDMLAVVHLAIRKTLVGFGIPRTGGVRTLELQKELKAKGASKTLNSRHLTGHAVDIYAIVNGQPSWAPEHVLQVHDAFMEAAEILGVPLRWGGDWNRNGIRERGENDIVHHELLDDVYGESMESRSALAAEFLRKVRAA